MKIEMRQLFHVKKEFAMNFECKIIPIFILQIKNLLAK